MALSGSISSGSASRDHKTIFSRPCDSSKREVILYIVYIACDEINHSSSGFNLVPEKTTLLRYKEDEKSITKRKTNIFVDRRCISLLLVFIFCGDIVLICLGKIILNSLGLQNESIEHENKKMPRTTIQKLPKLVEMEDTVSISKGDVSKHLRNLLIIPNPLRSKESCNTNRTDLEQKLIHNENFWKQSEILKVRTDHVHTPPLKVLPAYRCLDHFVNRVQKEGGLSREEEMCYEVRRFQSFNNARVKASPMRLARSGFFSTGSGDDTRCFSCGVTHRNWQLMDKVDQVHRSLSPGCLHLNGGDPRNVPMSSDSSEDERVVGVLEEYPRGTWFPQEQSTETPSIVITSQSNHSATALAAASMVSDPSRERLSQAAALPLTPAATAVESATSSTRDVMRLDISKAVHPQFKDLHGRLNSFRGWGYSHVQEPDILSKAGFYYAGYRDCVRCFYCGVGLRSWEKEDDPWVMHVRWRSSCDYIRAMKGEQFVVQALAGNPPLSTSTLTATNDATISHTEPNTPLTSNESETNTRAESSQSIPRHSGLEGLEMDVAAKAEEMGFQKSDIDTAIAELSLHRINTARGQNGVLQLEELLERLILLNDQPRSETVPRSASSRSTTGNASASPSNAASSSNNAAVPRNSSTVIQVDRFSSGGSSEPSSTTSRSTSGADGQNRQKKGSEETRVLSLDEERQLEEENQSLREESTCKICMDNPSCIVFLPCGHLVTCAECAPALRKCPICRAPVRGSVRAHTVTRCSRK